MDGLSAAEQRPYQTWGPAPQVQDTRGLSTTLMILVPLLVVSSILQMATQSGEVPVGSQDPFAGSNAWSFLTTPLWIACIVVGAIWVYRVTSNARAVGDPQRPSAGWAVGSLFIPLVSLVAPFFPIREAWTKSRAGPTGLLVAWWTAWAAYHVLGIVAGVWTAVWMFPTVLTAVSDGVTSLSLPFGIQVLGWITHAFFALAGGLFLFVVRRFDEAQASMARWLQGQANAPAGQAEPVRP